MTYEEVIKFIADNLTLETKVTREYIGSSDSPMYAECVTIKLVLCGNVISEVSL